MTSPHPFCTFAFKTSGSLATNPLENVNMRAFVTRAWSANGQCEHEGVHYVRLECKVWARGFGRITPLSARRTSKGHWKEMNATLQVASA